VLLILSSILTVSILQGLSTDDFYLIQNGKNLTETGVDDESDIHVCLRLLGGKGGFGSMLRFVFIKITLSFQLNQLNKFFLTEQLAPKSKRPQTEKLAEISAGGG
jgi:hypothetical protein